jgi:hypothetical protein
MKQMSEVGEKPFTLPLKNIYQASLLHTVSQLTRVNIFTERRRNPYPLPGYFLHLIWDQGEALKTEFMH